MTITAIDTVDAKEEFSKIINRVSHNKERILLIRRGKEIAAIVPIEDLELLQKSQSKNDLDQAIESLDEARKQGCISLADLKSAIG